MDCSINPNALPSGFPIEKITLDEFNSRKSLEADFLVWNNNIPFTSDDAKKVAGLRLLINWGSDDKNISPKVKEDPNIDIAMTKGYCTKAVADYIALNIARYPTSEDVVGLIGMGPIAYSLARRFEKSKANIIYHCLTEKNGIGYDYCQSVKELCERASIIVIAINHRESILTPEVQKALRDNPYSPDIFNVSRDATFPVSDLLELLDQGEISSVISDNPKTGDSATDPHKTGKHAYKSPAAALHKHHIVGGFLQKAAAQIGKIRPTLLLARHGETEWNLTKKVQGRANSPLTEKGERHAEALGKLFKDRGIEVIQTSPMLRGCYTAAIAAEISGAEISLVPNFIEMEFGEMTGRTMPEIAKTSFGEQRKQGKLFCPYPGGESYFDVGQRIQPDIDRILSEGRPTVILGHSSLNRMIYGYITGLPLAEAAEMSPMKDEVIEISFSSQPREFCTQDSDTWDIAPGREMDPPLNFIN